MTRDLIYEQLNELGCNLANFDEDYELAIDNYNFEYGCTDAEDHDDFGAWCVEYWG